MKTNVLYYGDNLTILRNREYFPDECIDLVYLDPPFNSKKDYNVLFKENGGVESEAQIKAFTDTWHWTESAQSTYHDIQTNAPLKVGKLIYSLYESLGQNDVMAYLVMMTARLIELHRVLKPTGSLYLHCDPTMSHYIKIVLDQIFSPVSFKNEIIWKRTTAHNTTSRRFGYLTDTIFFYAKSDKYIFNSPRTRHTSSYVDQFYRFAEADGRKYRLHLVERNAALGPRPNLIYDFNGYTPKYGWMMERKKLEEFDKTGRLVWSKNGRPLRKIYLDDVEQPKIGNLWDDIPPVQAVSKERLGYDTQKPAVLLERIINASSNEGDIVLDPFCGCGTAVVAAQKLNRKWIGIDITHLAINLMRNRLRDSFGIKAEVIGEPVDLSGAKELARNDRYQFQYWATGLIGARPVGEKKKGADAGIDGVITFIDDTTNKPKRVIVQVKSGHVGVATIRELETVSADEAIGVLITLEPPTDPMKQEAMSAGYYHSPIWNKDYDKIQILTAEELLSGKTVSMPPQTQTSVTFAKAPKITVKEGEQLAMDKE